MFPPSSTDLAVTATAAGRQPAGVARKRHITVMVQPSMRAETSGIGGTVRRPDEISGASGTVVHAVVGARVLARGLMRPAGATATGSWGVAGSRVSAHPASASASTIPRRTAEGRASTTRSSADTGQEMTLRPGGRPPRARTVCPGGAPRTILPMTRMRGESVRMVGAAVLGGLVTGLVLVGIAAFLGIRSEAVGAGTADAAHVRAVYRSVSPSVVLIDAGDRTGSGFLVDARGHVVTNAHVVGDRTAVDVDLGGRRVQATVRGVEPSVDVAVLTLKESQGDVPPLRFGDSAAVRIGDPVVAIGSPFGLNGSLSSGIVSGLRRQIDSPNGYAIQGVIQTDAALNPGNSGGPLLDMDGRVVGMATQIATESGTNEGIGFAVPSAVVERTATRIIATGHADIPYMGIVGGDVPEGVLLQQVVAGGPAAGVLRPGDVILAVDGTATTTNAGLAAALSAHAPGDRITVRVLRDGDETEVPVTLGTRPPTGPAAAP